MHAREPEALLVSGTVGSGKTTAAEALGHREFSMTKLYRSA